MTNVIEKKEWEKTFPVEVVNMLKEMHFQKNVPKILPIHFFPENMIRGLDSDECDFLSGVENLKAKQDLEKNKVNSFELSNLLNIVWWRMVFFNLF